MNKRVIVNKLRYERLRREFQFTTTRRPIIDAAKKRLGENQLRRLSGSRKRNWASFTKTWRFRRFLESARDNDTASYTSHQRTSRNWRATIRREINAPLGVSRTLSSRCSFGAPARFLGKISLKGLRVAIYRRTWLINWPGCTMRSTETNWLYLTYISSCPRLMYRACKKWRAFQLFAFLNNILIYFAT